MKSLRSKKKAKRSVLYYWGRALRRGCEEGKREEGKGAGKGKRGGAH
jgi:hypothetical protein